MADGTSTLRHNAPPGAAAQATATASASQSAAGAVAPVLLTDEQAAAYLGVGVRKFHELRAEAWMPQAVVLGPRLLRWPRAELEAAVTRMPRQSAPGVEPLHLKKARVAMRGTSEVAT